MAAMGGMGRMQLSRYKALLQLSDEAMELADRHNVEEGVLRYVLQLPVEAHTEMVQQIIQFNLTGKQVKEIVEQGNRGPDSDPGDRPAPGDLRLIKIMRGIERQTPQTLAQALIREEKSVHLARARLQAMVSYLKQVQQELPAEEL
jgi:hypothetical protein